MQILYDSDTDKLILKCASLQETDRIRELFGIEDTSSDGRIAISIEDFLKSPQNELISVENRAIEDFKPHVHIQTPLMGSARFNPGRNYICSKLGVGPVEFDAQRHALGNNEFILRLLERSNTAERIEIYDDLQRYLAMDTYRLFSEFNWLKAESLCLDIHLPILLRYFRRQLNDLKIIYLFRDPRDWMISLYYFFRHIYLAMNNEDFRSRHPGLFRQDGDDLDDFLRLLIDGEFVHLFAAGFYVFPSIKNLLEDRIAYRHHRNVFFVDYEKARFEPAALFSDFAKWMAGSVELPGQISEMDLVHAGELGSFKQQTGGQLSEGDSDEVQNLGGWVRKGMPGEWKTHCSPEIKRYFKIQTGTLLVDAGYEDNMDW